MPVMDPFLGSLNHLLMEEGMEDAPTCMQLDVNASYQAILGNFYDIIGEHPPPPPKPSVVSTSYGNFFDLNIVHQIADKQHAIDCNEVNILTHKILNSGSAANGNLIQSSFFQENRADSGPVIPRRHVVRPNLTALSTSKVQDYHAAIEFNDVQLLDTKVSCWEKDQDLNNLRSFSGRGSNAYFQLPSPFNDLSLKLSGVELSFEDLTLHDDYAALYVAEPGIRAGAPKSGNRGKGLAVAGKVGIRGKKRTADVQEYVDLRELIVNCAQAVAVGDAKVANKLLQNIRQLSGASADGSSSQRTAHYFSEALVARMRGTGSHHFRAILNKQPSTVTMLKVCKVMFDKNPLTIVTHYFANQSIVEAAEQASRLHIVDYGLEDGMQWAFLINALADQKGGPPLLVITGIDSPQPGNNPAQRLEESGRRLAAYARTYGVPFQYHAIASSKWEDLDSSSFHFHDDEILVVNFFLSLRHLTDESVDMVFPRQRLLRCIHSLKPHLLIAADMSAANNSSFFVSRFREALYFYSNLIEMFDTLYGGSPEVHLWGRIIYGRILNIVACEGAERVERAETYKQWEVIIKRAGFEQLLIPPWILSRVRSHMKQHYDKDFFVHDDANKWMLLGWKGRNMLGVSAWKLSNAA